MKWDYTTTTYWEIAGQVTSQCMDVVKESKSIISQWFLNPLEWYGKFVWLPDFPKPRQALVLANSLDIDSTGYPACPMAEIWKRKHPQI